MKSKTFMVVSVALVLLLLVTAGAFAMASANYWLNWFTPLSGSGGGPSSSASYSANFTIGQTVTGRASSANYQATTGYWAGAGYFNSIFVPFINK